MNEALKEKFFEYLTDHGISQNRAAREIDYSSAVLSQYRKSGYQGDVEKLEDSVEKWLEKQQRKNRIRKVEFVETDIFKKVYRSLQVAHEEKTMGFIVGAAGIGKTVAIEKYRDENANVIIIQGESGLKENDVVRKIARILNIKGNRIVTLKEMIVEELTGKEALVIVEEANYLHPPILDMLRRVIFDQGDCPVVFVGVKELMSNIFLNPRDFQQLQRRIGVWSDLSGQSLGLKEVKAITNTIFPEVTDTMVKYLKEATGGNPGVLSLLVERAYRICMLNDKPWDEELIESCKASVFLTAKKR